MKHLAVLTITLLLLGLSTTPAAGEVIFDEGFEQSTWDDDWFYDEHNWRGTKELTTDNPHSGNQCLFMKGSDWSPGGCSYMTPLVDYPLQSAHVSFWIRDFQYVIGDGGDGFFKIVFTDTLGQLARLEEVPYRNDGYLSLLVADPSLNYTPSTYKIADYPDWVHISIEFTTGANTRFSVRVNDSPAIDVHPEIEFAAISQIGIGVGGQYYNTGECYLDDFSINSISSCSYITATRQNENGSGAQTILIDPSGITADTLLGIGGYGVWSDDMTEYVFSHTSAADNYTEIYLYDRMTGTTNQLTDYNATVSGQSSPRFWNESEIWWVRPCGYGCSELWRMELDGSNPQQLSNFNTSGKQMLEMDILGDTIYYTVQSSSSSPTAEVYSAIIYADGSESGYVEWSSANQLTSNGRRERGVRVSSDGSKLTFIQAQGSNGFSDPQQIVVMNSDGTNAQLITGGADNWSSPVWSPDGSKIACNHPHSDGTFDLYTINVDGSNPQLLTNTPGVNEHAADWRIHDCTQILMAEFTAHPVAGTVPLTVNFTDQSVGDITSWEWDFGDGNMSTEQNPSHEYSLAGTYSISLTVSGAGGTDLETKADYVMAYEPVACADFDLTATYSVGDAPVSIVSEDLDGDGYGDLVVSHRLSSSIAVLLNGGDGTMKPGAFYSVGSQPELVVASDLDGDGDKDLAVANRGSNEVSVLLNDGEGAFQAAVNYPAGSGAYGLCSADFDGDADNDLATANYESDNVSILINNGNGTFQPAVHYQAGNGACFVYAADIDDDVSHSRDLIVVNHLDDNISIILNHGDGTFSVSPDQTYATGDGPISLTALDLDNDPLSSPDLAVAHEYSNYISIFLNSGDGTLQDPANYEVGQKPMFVVSSDLDNQMGNDLLVANAYSDNVSILFNSGDGTFQGPVSYSVGDHPRAVDVDDFDLDGDCDLAVANKLNGTVSILSNIGTCPRQLSLEVEPNTMYAFYAYAYSVDPLKGSAYVEDFPNSYNVDSVELDQFLINGTIVPVAASIEESHDDSSGAVVKIDFDMAELVASYGTLYDTTNQPFMVTGLFADNTPLVCFDTVFVIGHTSGDVNLDGQVNISDLSYLVDYLFRGGPPPYCLDGQNCNAEYVMTVSNLSQLVDYLFRGGVGPESN